MFPKTAIEMEHVESTWAGIRPLIHEEEKGLLKYLEKMKFGFQKLTLLQLQAVS